jgi:hypothetical protein
MKTVQRFFISGNMWLRALRYFQYYLPPTPTGCTSAPFVATSQAANRTHFFLVASKGIVKRFRPKGAGKWPMSERASVTGRALGARVRQGDEGGGSRRRQGFGEDGDRMGMRG